MSLRFAVVYEADADFRTATELTDRVLIEAISWVEDHLSNQREWLAKTPSGEPLSWKRMKHLARDAGIRVHGQFDGEPGEPDAAAASRAIRLLLKTVPDLNAIVLIRDQDDQPQRRIGLEQARRRDQSGIAIVVGLAIVERECWVVSGFEPLDETETARLASEKRNLGFDPRLQSHQLTACKNDNAAHSPKRVLRMLMGNELDRECRCWRETPLDVLRERGQENGLVEYLTEVRDRLAPLIGHVSKD